MMKLVSFAAIAGTAAAADVKPSSYSSRRPDGPTKEDMESATRQFIKANLGKKKSGNTPASDGSSGRRSLRSSSLRKERSGKGGKDVSSGSDDRFGNDMHHGPHYDDDDRHTHDDDDWHNGYSGKSGKSGNRSGKGGKWGGSGSGSGDGWGHEELFYLLPTACPGECVTSHTSGSTDEFIDAIKTCKEGEETHMWLVRSDGSYIMIESYYEHGMCIGVDYEHGDSEAQLANACYNGELILTDCHSDYGTEWYFTGGQLVNSLCWGAGLSSMMTVFIDGKDNDKVKECRKDVAIWGANDEAVLKADTFMFVNRLPEAPFRIDDVNEALDEKVKKNDNKKAAITTNSANMLVDVEGST